MGLCKTSNFSIFTFINASDLKFNSIANIDICFIKH